MALTDSERIEFLKTLIVGNIEGRRNAIVEANEAFANALATPQNICHITEENLVHIQLLDDAVEILLFFVGLESFKGPRTLVPLLQRAEQYLRLSQRESVRKCIERISALTTEEKLALAETKLQETEAELVALQTKYTDAQNNYTRQLKNNEEIMATYEALCEKYSNLVNQVQSLVKHL